MNYLEAIEANNDLRHQLDSAIDRLDYICSTCTGNLTGTKKRIKVIENICAVLIENKDKG